MKGDRFDVLARNMKFPMPSLEQNVARLLRKEHAAVKRMVKMELAKHRASDWSTGRVRCVLQDILAALDKRAKGGKG